MVGQVRLAGVHEAMAFAEHVRAADADSGVNGPHFHPYSAGSPPDVLAIVTRAEASWELPLTAVGWRRAFVWVVDGEFVGHLTLHGGGLATELHRGSVGMGLLPDKRGEGGGTALLAAAIAWAKAQPSLVWLDLGVFHDNPRAQRLYERMGFEVNGRKRDCFRVDGVSLDDISLALFVGADA